MEKEKKGEVSVMKKHNIKRVTVILKNTYRYETYQRNISDKMRMAFSAKRRYQGHDVSNCETRKGDREVGMHACEYRELCGVMGVMNKGFGFAK